MKVSIKAVLHSMFGETRLRPLPGTPTPEDYFVAEMQRRADDHQRGRGGVSRRGDW
ncbi:MAG: hypothetical protein WBA67_07415 [Jannaschia sp.]